MERFEEIEDKIWGYLHALDELKEYKFVDEIEYDINSFKEQLKSE